MRHVGVLVLLLVNAAAAGEPRFIKWRPVRPCRAVTVYGDVMCHATTVIIGSETGRGTDVHETLHNINAEIAIKLGQVRSFNESADLGIYCLEDRAVVLSPARIGKSHVAAMMPRSVWIADSQRCNNYLVAVPWDRRPLYMFDEWSAYVTNSKHEIEEVRRGLPKQTQYNRDISGCVAGSLYGVATCMAIAQYDPDYWRDQKQCRALADWMMHEAGMTYSAGQKLLDRAPDLDYPQTQQILNALRHNPDAATMRQFIGDTFTDKWLLGH